MYEVVGIYRTVQSPDSAMMPSIQTQRIITDGGPWAEHNVACAVCGDKIACLDLNRGIFLPCDACRKKGWNLQKKRKRFWRKRD